MDGFQDKKTTMKCHVCGGKMCALVTDLPFKVSETSIVIVKSLPVIQCDNCSEYLIEDPVMERLETLLSNVDLAAELEVVSYAA